MIIFFGSQTGTAEDYATRIAREAKQYGFDPIVADFENYAFVRSRLYLMTFPSHKSLSADEHRRGPHPF